MPLCDSGASIASYSATILSRIASAYSNMRAASGTKVVIQKTVNANAFLTAGAALTGAAVGRFYVENVLLECDSGSVTTATNLQVTASNVYGASLILSEAIANVTASKTVDINSASVAKQRTILESGKALSFSSTGSNAGGTGVVRITAILTLLDDGATIAVA